MFNISSNISKMTCLFASVIALSACAVSDVPQSEASNASATAARHYIGSAKLDNRPTRQLEKKPRKASGYASIEQKQKAILAQRRARLTQQAHYVPTSQPYSNQPHQRQAQYQSQSQSPRYYTTTAAQPVGSTQARRVVQNPQATYSQPTAYTQPTAKPQFIRTQSGQPLEVYSHTVREGETAYGLAKRYCSQVEDIRNINALEENYKIKIGESVIIPRTRC